jgi:hypothetical protein
MLSIFLQGSNYRGVPKGRLKVAQDVVLGTKSKHVKSPVRDG